MINGPLEVFGFGGGTGSYNDSTSTPSFGCGLPSVLVAAHIDILQQVLLLTVPSLTWLLGRYILHVLIPFVRSFQGQLISGGVISPSTAMQLSPKIWLLMEVRSPTRDI